MHKSPDGRDWRKAAAGETETEFTMKHPEMERNGWWTGIVYKDPQKRGPPNGERKICLG